MAAGTDPILALTRALRENANNTRAVMSLSDSIGTLTGAGGITDLVSTMGKFIKEAGSLSVEATRQGTTIGSVSESLGPQLGKLAGRNTELTNALEMLDSGLSINNEQLRLLSLQTKTTGGDTRALQQTFRRLSLTTGATNEELAGMSTRLMRMRDTYKISTDKLVASMSDLASNLEMAFYGVTQEFSLAIADLEGKFGVGAADPFKRLTDQLLNPEFFGRALQFGLQDEIDVLTDSASTQDQIQRALMSVIETMKPQIDNMRKNLKGMGSQTVALERLGDYFGGKEFVGTIEQLAKLRPVDRAGLEGAKPEDAFKNLETALNKATTFLQELGNKVLPVLIDNMGLVVKGLTFVGTILLTRGLGQGLNNTYVGLRNLTAETVKLGRLFGVSNRTLTPLIRGAGTIGRVIPWITRFLGPIGLLVSLLMTFLPEILSFFGDEDEARDEQAEAQKKEAAEAERKRLAEERLKLSEAAKAAIDYRTNTFLQLQSKSLDATIREIVRGNDSTLQIAGLQGEQVELMKILINVVNSNSKRGVAPIPGMASE